MSPMMQHKSPELPTFDGSAHALPRLLKLPVIARRNDLCEEGPTPVYYTTGTPVLPHETAMPQHYYFPNSRCAVILAGHACSEGAAAPKDRGFRAKTPVFRCSSLRDDWRDWRTPFRI